MLTDDYKHHQVWAAASTATPDDWERIHARYGWVENPPALQHVVDGWFSYVGVGPANWHQHCDLANIAEDHRARDILSQYRGADGDAQALPPVNARPGIKAHVAASQAACRCEGMGTEGHDAAEAVSHEGKRKKRKLNRLERIEALYINSGWESRARLIVHTLRAEGLAGILPKGKFDPHLAYMQKWPVD
jgi:hypothetical protein